LNSVDLIISGENGDPDHDKILQETLHSNFTYVPRMRYKHLCGEFETSSAFATWLAYRILNDRMMPHDSDVENFTGQDAKSLAKETHRILILNLEGRSNLGLQLLERVMI
jgi:hypothetical protein